MPAIVKNLIHEVSTTTGLGDFTLTAVNGKVRFSDATYGFGTGTQTNKFDYFISNRDAAEWEIGTGHMSAVGTLVRDIVVLSSNANAAVNFSAGTKDVTNSVPAAGRRIRLSANTTFFVRTTGNDTTGDGSANDDAHAFATPEGAWSFLSKNVDGGGYAITIQFNAGTYGLGASGFAVLNITAPIIGAAWVSLTGSGVVVFDPNSDGEGGIYVQVTLPSGILVSGIKFQNSTSTTWSAAIMQNAPGKFQIDTGCEFGSWAVGAHMAAFDGGFIQCFNNNYTISGGAAYHWEADRGAVIDVEGATVTLTGTPAFSVGFAVTSGGFIQTAATFTGAATGPRFSISGGGALRIMNASYVEQSDTYLPGNAAGTLAKGTVYNATLNANIGQLDLEDQTLAGGARVTVKDLGNLSTLTITPDPGDRPIQKITNNGAGTIAPGSNVGTYILIVKNTTGAGAITTSGWQDVSGEAFDTTTTSEFVCHCTITGDLSALVINKVA